ncbi:hypothetical protein HDE_03443 [Halotydeus destructor]|nr:hypothetical protein HDE_03443 [Halotydeus destructor]
MFAEFIPLITTVSYMAFLPKLNDPIFRIAIVAIYCELFIMFSAICMAASRVSKSVHGCHKHMIGLTNPSLGHEINLKVMRSASLYDRPIGIQCGKLFVVSYETYFTSVAEITSYFLLMVNVVQGGKKSFLYYFLYF